MRRLLLIAAFMLLALPAAAHDYKLGALSIGHIHAPPPQAGATGVPVYGPLLNRGEDAVILRGASSPVAKSVRLRIDKGGARSWPATLTLEPGKPLALAAWRVHLWVEGLRGDYGEGDTIPITLDFGAAGSIDIEAVVEREAGH